MLCGDPVVVGIAQVARALDCGSSDQGSTPCTYPSLGRWLLRKPYTVGGFSTDSLSLFMVTRQQKYLGARAKHKPTNSFRKASRLAGPQRKGACVKVWSRRPKKPNSAQRKGGSFLLVIPGTKTKRIFAVGFPGEGSHNLAKYSVALIRGGRKRDLPGVKFEAIRGALDFQGLSRRKTSRSKYGSPKPRKLKGKSP